MRFDRLRAKSCHARPTEQEPAFLFHQAPYSADGMDNAGVPSNVCDVSHVMCMLLQGGFAVWTVKHKVETSFDETDFLEGAKDAWVAGDILTHDVFV